MLSPGAVEPCQHHGDIGTSLHTAGAGNNQWDSVKKDMTILQRTFSKTVMKRQDIVKKLQKILAVKLSMGGIICFVLFIKSFFFQLNVNFETF